MVLKSHFVTRRLVSRYCVFVDGCFVSWKSKKHTMLSRSLVEVQYRSMASATCEVMWVLKNMKDLDVESLVLTNLYCDNKSTIQIANPVMPKKSKHFDIDAHLVRENVSSMLIINVKVYSKENTADILTKALGSF
ncbi:hypothetical protein Tco_0010724 [Tanacetum coccineum]